MTASQRKVCKMINSSEKTKEKTKQSTLFENVLHAFHFS